MKIPSSIHLKQLDKATLLKQGIASFDLMERAAKAVFDSIREDFISKNPEVSFTVIAGAGNNGGDGLALARMLCQLGADVQVYLFKKETYSADNLYNQERLLALGVNIHSFDPSSVFCFRKQDVVVDALFGFGLKRPLSDLWFDIIHQINQANIPVISIDLPSGLLADGSGNEKDLIVRATIVYTFQVPKIALLLPKSGSFAEKFKVLDILLDKTALEEVATDHYYYMLTDAVADVIKRKRFNHKGSFGHTLIIGGSYGKIGAVIMGAKAALTAGCGMVTAYVPECGYTALQSCLPEAMVLTDSNNRLITSFPSVSSFSAVGIGVGMGMKDETVSSFSSFLRIEKDLKMVLDADAINILSEKHRLLYFLPANTILTPHPKELQRLIGSWTTDLEKLKKAKEFCLKYKCILIIKGANTVTVLPSGKMYFNASGNVGMATAGSGDVLTGILTSLLAQGYIPEKAAVFGVFLHGLAGDFAQETLSTQSMTAIDIINNLYRAYNHLNTS